jgi:putative ABC transport system permease protein
MHLSKKMARDIWRTKAQFLTIIIIVACGVFAFAGTVTIGSRLEQSVTDFYEETRLNDVWIHVNGANAADVAHILSLEQVEEAQGRTVVQVHSGNSKLDLYMLQENRLSQPYLMEGAPFTPGDEGIWLDREYARANGLQVGDRLPLSSADHHASMEIEGLVLSPERVTDTSTENPSIRHDLYGYAYVGKNSAVVSGSSGQWNQIIVTTRPGTDLERLNADIEKLLGDTFISAVNRQEYNSTASVEEQIVQFSSLAYIAPVLFFLLAMLIVVSTMGRLIASQRIQIGTLMSLGFSSRQIKWHYISYGLWMGVIGGVLGLLLGTFGMPAIFMRTLTQSFILPRWSTAYAPQTLLALVLICLCCILAVWLACGSKLKAMPSTVLKGPLKKRPPQMLMERFSALWERLGFDFKWILRSINANRVRTLMGLIASFACTFLILFGFANINTSNRSVSLSYDNQYLYAYKAEIKNPQQAASGLPSSGGLQFIQEGKIDIRNGAVRRHLPFKAVGTGSFINLDMNSSTPMTLSDKGLILSKTTAAVLGVAKGDSVEWRYAGGAWSRITVAELVELPTANEVFISRAAWESGGHTFVPTSILAGSELAVLKELQENPGIAQIVSKADMKEAMFKLNEGVFGTAISLTASAILLGSTVIYSLGLINLTEMGREFATLKVLGFRHREMKRLLVRENVFFTIAGILLALPAGRWMIDAMAKMNNSESMVLFPDIKPLSYALAVMITLACSYTVNQIISRKIAQIDMITSLKSVE